MLAKAPDPSTHNVEGDDAFASKLCSYNKKGRIAVSIFGHINPLLAFPAILRFSWRRNTVDNRISPAENNKC